MSLPSLDRIPHADRRRFRTGRPCLDLVHTGGEGELVVWELVHSAEDLGRYLAVILDLAQVDADDRDLGPMRALRSAITRVALALAAGGTLDPGDVATINRVAETAPLVPRLRIEGGVETVRPNAPAALSTLARDAVDLFGGPLRERIRVCAAPDCGLLLVDTSRPGNRRWCSMQRCGNLAKVRAHRARAKA